MSCRRFPRAIGGLPDIRREVRLITVYVVRANGLRFGPFPSVDDAARWGLGYLGHCTFYDTSMTGLPAEFAIEEIREASPTYLEAPQ